MTPSELKYKYEENAAKNNKPAYFFTRKTMKFFGDTMKNYGCYQSTIDTDSDKDVEVYCLYRKNPVKNGLQKETFFRKTDFTIVFSKN